MAKLVHMKKITTASLLLLSFYPIFAQNLYFPPLAGNDWETISPDSLGWCVDEIPPLYDFLDQENSKAFIVLKDGKIVLEKYFDGFTQDSLWYWASAGKSVTGVLVGIAQQEGLLDLDDPSGLYLDSAWTACPPDKEALITVRHQLTMTTGLDDSVADLDCTDPDCLFYLADAGTRWSYHNAPYTLLDGVIEHASGQSLNSFFVQKLRNKTGMNGAYFQLGYNNVLVSTPRSMARFGLLMLNKGVWENTPVLADPSYFDQMTNSSQLLNPSYGYLWWLNGKDTYKVPGLQFDFPGPLIPAAPSDMVSAMGKNGQFVNVVPSLGLVFIRMGDAPDNSLVPFLLNNQIWEYLNEVIYCEPSATAESGLRQDVRLSPNPATNLVHLEMPAGVSNFTVKIASPSGIQCQGPSSDHQLDVSALPNGIYFISVAGDGFLINKRLIISR